MPVPLVGGPLKPLVMLLCAMLLGQTCCLLVSRVSLLAFLGINCIKIPLVHPVRSIVFHCA